MSRRCKPGQRARIIAGCNDGKIVLVVRPYFGETVANGSWPMPIFPWFVTSLSTPLVAEYIETGKKAQPNMSAVYDDDELEPLDDDDDGLELTTVTEKPAAVSTTVRMPKRAPQIARKKPVAA